MTRAWNVCLQSEGVRRSVLLFTSLASNIVLREQSPLWPLMYSSKTAIFVAIVGYIMTFTMPRISVSKRTSDDSLRRSSRLVVYYASGLPPTRLFSLVCLLHQLRPARRAMDHLGTRYLNAFLGIGPGLSFQFLLLCPGNFDESMTRWTPAIVSK